MANKLTGETLKAFIKSHRNEIIGIYRDTYYKDGGWNGLIEATVETLNKYKQDYDVDETTCEELQTLLQ